MLQVANVHVLFAQQVIISTNELKPVSHVTFAVEPYVVLLAVSIMVPFTILYGKPQFDKE